MLLRQRREHRAVSRGVAGTGHLPTQDQQLMAKDCDLHVLGVWGWAQVDQPEDLSEDHERQGAHHHLRAALDLCLATPRQARTGLHLAGTLWFYFTGCGFLREGRHWLGRLLAAAPSPARNGPRRCGPPARSRSPRAIPRPPTASSSRAGNRRPRPETNGSSGWPE